MSEQRNNLPLDLSICGVDELQGRLKRFKPTHVISISDPVDRPLDFPSAIDVLRLAFWDIQNLSGFVSQMVSYEERDHYPIADHAEAILGFGRNIPKSGKLLIHCWAGVSRSTAAAMLVICQRNPGHEQSAFRLVKSLRPQAAPNRLIVKHGDRLLKAGGRMLAALDAANPPQSSRHEQFLDLG